MSNYTITCMPFLSETQNTSGQWTVQVRDPNGNIEQTMTLESEAAALKLADDLTQRYNTRPSLADVPLSS